MKLGMVVVSMLLGIAVASAQQGRVPAKILQQGDLSVRGREVVTVVADFSPASDTGWHTHPGEMVGYMVAGSVVIQQQGQPPVTVRTGESFIIRAGAAHNQANIEQTPARMFVTYVVEKGKPLRTNVAARP